MSKFEVGDIIGKINMLQVDQHRESIMKRLLLIIVCVLIVTGCGYLISYLIYTPKILAYKMQVNGLTLEVHNLTQAKHDLEQSVINQEALISSQMTEIGILETESTNQKATIANHEQRITSLEEENSNLENELTVAQSEINTLNSEVTTLNNELSSERTRLNDILNISVTQNYQWKYRNSDWSWTLPINLATYVSFLERSRPSPISQYVNMARDSEDDEYIMNMVNEINKAAQQKGYSDVQKLNFVVSLVQSLPYTVDSETTPSDEYPRYPIETLFDRGGDCEDSSILVAALLKGMGYDVALLHLEDAQHMAVGVVLPSAYGTYYEHNGKRYFYIETTGEGWGVGDLPPDITESTAFIYPLDS